MIDATDPIASLPLLPRNVLSRQESSYNRGGVNHDCGNFLYIDGNGEAVLFDAYGPGCINSIFATVIPEDTVLHFYFDESPEPQLSLPMTELFSGGHPLFPAPMASYRTLGYYLGEKSTGGNALMRIPFQKALRITSSGGREYFHHILWEQYAWGTPAGGFPDGEANRRAGELWRPPLPRDDPMPEDAAAHTLQPEQPETVFSAEGSACITSISIEGGSEEYLLNDIHICMRWDDAPYDDVRAPLGHFFAVPAGPADMDTPLISVTRLGRGRIRLASRWPMPYWRSASISLVNKGTMPLAHVRVSVETSPQRYPMECSGYFTAQYRAGQTVYGKDWILFQNRGWGKYVGTVQRMLGEHYCEGDDHFTLDGACTPQINGTGTEDYFLFCLWPNPFLCTPYNGSTTDVYEKGGAFYDNAYRFPSAYYRFHIDGPIAFYSEIDAKIQHGGMSDIRSNYASLAVCYLRRSPALALGDCLDPANEASRRMHEYASAPGETVTTESTFIGEGIDVRQRLAGCEHAGGDIRFRLAVDGKNAGVMLRRRIDQAHARQKANVYVDGAYAGVWYHADGNPTHRWRDSDFLLPEELTRGKDLLEIRLEVLPCGESRFTSYGYKAYSFLKSI